MNSEECLETTVTEVPQTSVAQVETSKLPDCVPLEIKRECLAPHQRSSVQALIKSTQLYRFCSIPLFMSPPDSL